MAILNWASACLTIVFLCCLPPHALAKAYSVVNPCEPSPCGPNSRCGIINSNPICSCLPEFIGLPPVCRHECVKDTDCSNNLACVDRKCKKIEKREAREGKPSKVNCDANVMTVIVPLDLENEKAYLDQLKGYDICAPSIENGAAVFKLDLSDVHKCGVTRLLHQPTGKRVFYHKVIVESESGREIISVRCSLGPIVPVGPHQIHRRDLDLPVGFQEPENLEITTSYTERAPEPQLGVAVSQNGKEVSGEISVRPGTPLTMKVFLDKESAPVYGLMVSHLQVSDTVAQQETIVFNGCSVDPYLFDNFVTNDGDLLEAKFRAFKFPDTTYVQFRGTVNVCLDKCQGTQCSNGATGFGRKKRSILSGSDSNRLFEISLTTFIKVEDDSNEADMVSKLLKNLKIANQMLEENSPRMVNEESSGEVLTATVREKPQNIDTSLQTLSLLNKSARFEASFAFVLAAVVLQILWRFRS